MTLKLKVVDGHIEMPTGISLPEGSELQAFVVPAAAAITENKPFSFRTFRGDGLQPGIDINDNASVRRALDEPGKFSQLL